MFLIRIYLQKLLFPIILLCLTLFYLTPMQSMADKIIHSRDEPARQKNFNYIPYALHTEELQTGIGLGFGWSGQQQGQAGLYGAVLYTSNDSSGLFLRGSRWQLNNRLFLDATIFNTLNKNDRIYIRNNPDFPSERGGTNESSEANYLTSPGRRRLFELDFYYVLPFGDGNNNILKEYILADGMLSSPPSGGQYWNPRHSGRSYLHLIPFYQSQIISQDTGKLHFKTNGIKLEFEYDNRDFPDNPTYGSYQEFRLLRDFGAGDSSDSWTVVDFQASKYFSLGETDKMRQRVIALNIWTADTPTWEQIKVGTNITDRHRPPPFMGATLGGVKRMRAYPGERFNDKAAIYYSAEYRLMPRANPLGEISLLRIFDIDWWQFVAFAELGRVAPSWNINTLHQDMQQSIGLGVRAMALRTILRIDAAFSDEAWQIYAMVGHPF